jgi:hypothetical protein
MRYPDLADTPIVVLKNDARRDGLADRLEFEKSVSSSSSKNLKSRYIVRVT